MREDAETPKEETAEKAEEKTEESKAVSTGGSGGKVEQSTAPATVKAETGHNDEDEHALRQLLAKLEQHVSWSQRGYKLDGGQLEYLDRIKGFVSGFSSLSDLLVYLLRFAPESEGRLFPSTVVFLMLVYLSDKPERYLPMFVLSPLEYYESPLTNARSYEFDGVLAYHDKITSRGAWFNDPAGLTDIKIYDFDEVENLGTKTAFANTDTSPAGVAASGHRSLADHKNGYSFVVEPAAGKSIKGNLINSLKYDNYTSDTQSTEVTIATKDGNWEITDYKKDGVVNKGSVKVTITPEALKKAYDAGRVVNDSPVGREITVGFESTRTKAAEISVPIVCYDGSVTLVDRMRTDFIASTDADYVMDVKSCVEDFSNYSMGSTSKFLSVQVKDEKGDVITADTKELVGTGIVEITNGNNSTDYHTLR